MTTIWVTLLLVCESAALVIALAVALAVLLQAAGETTAVTGAGEIAKEAYRGFKDKYCPLVEWK